MTAARVRSVGGNVDQLKGAIEECVIPGFQRLTTFLKDVYVWEARKEAGIWCVPSGDSIYRGCAEYFTSLDLSPQELHELGLAEVDRITDKIHKVKRDPHGKSTTPACLLHGKRRVVNEALAARGCTNRWYCATVAAVTAVADGQVRRLLGEDDEESDLDYVGRMRENPLNHFTKSSEILDRYTEIIEKAQHAMPYFFDNFPAGPLLVSSRKNVLRNACLIILLLSLLRNEIVWCCSSDVLRFGPSNLILTHTYRYVPLMSNRRLLPLQRTTIPPLPQRTSPPYFSRTHQNRKPDQNIRWWLWHFTRGSPAITFNLALHRYVNGALCPHKSIIVR